MNSNNCGCAKRGEKAEALGRGDRAALEASEEPVLTDNVLTLNNAEKTASWGPPACRNQREACAATKTQHSQT